MVITVYKTRFPGVRLDVSGWILQPDQFAAGCNQPARDADKTGALSAGCLDPAKVADRATWLHR